MSEITFNQINFLTFYYELLTATQLNACDKVLFMVHSANKQLNTPEIQNIYTTSLNYSLFKAIEMNNLTLFSIFINYGADISNVGTLGLKIAAMNGNLAIVKSLVNSGAKIGKDNNWDMKYAIMNNHIDIVMFFCSKNTYKTTDILEFIKLALFNTRYNIAKFLIIKSKCNISEYTQKYPEFKKFILSQKKPYTKITTNTANIN